MHKNQYPSPWEKESANQNIDTINPEVFTAFIKKAESVGRLLGSDSSVGAVLSKLRLLHGDQLTRAAELLFCDQSPMEVQGAVFAGKDKITFLDIQKFDGPLFSMLEKSERYIREKINWRIQFGKLEREEIPEIPLEAIREALVNSLCHRDFANPKGNEIAIFKDRIEIYNPGSLPQGLTPDDFLSGSERSYLRNPLIAEAFYRRGDVEKWGSGLKRIYDACLSMDVDVRFNQMKTGFLVTFMRNSGAKGGVKSGIEGSIKKDYTLTARQQEIFELIQQNNTISLRELARLLAINPSAVQKHIEQLKKKGAVVRVGPRKGGHWEVNV